MRIRSKAAQFAAIGGLTVAALAGSVATAAWTVNGNFNFLVPGGEIQKLQVSHIAVHTEGLLPGQSADLTFRLKNPNPIAVRGVAKASHPATGYLGTISSTVEGCEDHVELKTGTTSSYSWVDERFEAGQVKDHRVEDAFYIKPSSPDTCENANYTVVVQTSATSAS